MSDHSRNLVSQRRVTLGLAAWCSVGIFVGVIAMYLFNYTRPLTVEESRTYAEYTPIYSKEAVWEQHRNQVLNFGEYEQQPLTVEELFLTLELNIREGESHLTVEETLEFFAERNRLIQIEVKLCEVVRTRTARTGWLVWSQAQDRKVETAIGISLMLDNTPGGYSFGYRHWPLLVFRSTDPDFELTKMMAVGSEKRESLLPVRISRPGR